MCPQHIQTNLKQKLFGIWETESTPATTNYSLQHRYSKYFHIQVQTEDQYIFVHDALLEAIGCGNTELPAGDLFNHLHKLTSSNGDNPVTGMEVEFKVRFLKRLMGFFDVPQLTVDFTFFTFFIFVTWILKIRELSKIQH